MLTPPARGSLRSLHALLLASLAACGSGPDATAPDASIDGAPTDGAVPDADVDFTPGQVPAEAPPWVAGLTPGVWTPISTNVLADVDPENDPAANPNHPGGAPWRGNEGQSGVIEDWCGGIYAHGFGPYGSLAVFGGGHSGYYGNEVYAFDLGTRAWSRLSRPYPTPHFGAIDAYPTGFYPDGTPVPSHTSDKLEYDPVTNSLVTLEVEVNNFGGYTLSTPAMFSFEHRTWRKGPTSREFMYGFGWSAYDAGRRLIWTEGGYGGSRNPVSTFDPAGANGDGTFGRWVNLEPQTNENGTVGAYDPLHDLLAITRFRQSGDIVAIDAAAPTTPMVVIRTAGPRPALRQSHGWEWSATRRAFIYWAGDHVFELRPAANWRSDPWTWVDLTNPASTVTPAYSMNGVFGRFRIARYGSVEVAITINSVRGPVYAFRLPG